MAKKKGSEKKVPRKRVTIHAETPDAVPLTPGARTRTSQAACHARHTVTNHDFGQLRTNILDLIVGLLLQRTFEEMDIIDPYSALAIDD